MCCNGDGAQRYDDDEWCAASGALNIRDEILKIYAETYEAERMDSFYVEQNVAHLKRRLKRHETHFSSK